MRGRRLVGVVAFIVCCGAGLWPARAAAGTAWYAGLVPASEHQWQSPARQSSVGHAYVPGELLVEFRDDVGGSELRKRTREIGAVLARRLPAVGTRSRGPLVLVRSRRLTTRQLATRFRADPAVIGVSPNYLRRIDAVPPDDPGLAAQWALADVRAGDAWSTTTGAADVVVVSLDTGVDLLHPDLVANLWHNPGEIPGNASDDDGNGYVDDEYGIDTAYDDSVPMDDDGHGTHTSGIIAAVGDNGRGVAGITWHTRIMALKFINEWGYGTDADAIECIDYAVREKLEHGVNVVAINASWGGGAANLFLRNAIDRAGAAGIVFCASAGNEGCDNDEVPHYPSSHDCATIVSVAATGCRGGLTDWSNRGRCSVDLGAPGEDVLSTMAAGGYMRASGTSMASPYVAGVVALCAARHPDETARERVARVVESARATDDLAGEVLSGGTLDAAAALGTGGAADLEPPVTTVLGVDRFTHDAPVDVILFASDGVGGSGVASTEWRLDGGEWAHGVVARVPAPRRTKVTRVVSFRSADRSGNVETVRRVAVRIDTRYRSRDDVPPGVPLPLPPAPVHGDLCVPWDPVDVYHVRMEAGQSFLAICDRVPADSVAVLAHASGRPFLGVWWMDDETRFARTAPRDGTYLFALLVGDFEGAPAQYRFSYQLVPRGIDVVPPEVDYVDDARGWSHQAVAVRIVADDGPLGSGVQRCETSTDGGLTWGPNDEVLVEAPPDHSNDGHHFIHYRAVDMAGNVSSVGYDDVRIDTCGPHTQAWGPARPVRRGACAVVEYRVDDLAEWVLCRLVVRSVATGRIVAVKRLGVQPTVDTTWWDPEHRHRCVITCRYPAGEYTVQVAGYTRDPAGNRWESATCERPLVVR